MEEKAPNREIPDYFAPIPKTGGYFQIQKVAEKFSRNRKKTLKGALRCLKAAKQKTSGPLGKED